MSATHLLTGHAIASRDDFFFVTRTFKRTNERGSRCCQSNSLNGDVKICILEGQREEVRERAARGQEVRLPESSGINTQGDVTF